MVGFLIESGVEGKSILEVGGGIGGLHMELLREGAAHVTNVELSNGYEAVAAELLEEKGYTDRVDRRLGDFTEVGVDLRADFVVMNRVVCCYPDMPKLIGAATRSSRRFVAASFPRDRLAAKITVGLGNLYCRARSIDFRGFVHPTADIMATARESGFVTAFTDQDFTWNAMVFERAEAARPTIQVVPAVSSERIGD